ncbi:MAG TPA: trigger factor [Desulfobacteraceae bacterium]|nr:trigger factor [Desulfobacteraceae bacterium]
MKTTVEEITSTMKKIIVEIGEDEVARKLDEAYHSLSRNVKIPGFRPGKAPRSVLETRFGDQVREDVSREFVANTFPAAITEADMNVLGYPQIEKDVPTKGKPFTYSASMEVRPAFEVKDFKGVEVQKEKVEVTDEQVQARLDAIVQSHGKLKPVDDRETIEENDYVVLDYKAFEGEEPIEDTSAENYMLHVGSGDFHPIFEKSLIGIEKGVEKDIEVDFEETFHHTKLAGKHIRFHVVVSDIKTVELPPLDDDFARGLGGDFADLEDLKTKVRESMLLEMERRTDKEAKQRLLEKISASVQVDLPRILVDSELNYAIDSVKQNLARSGLSVEKAGISDEKLSEELLPASEKRVKEMLVLGQIARQENLQLEDQDLDDAFNSMAAAASQPPDVLRRYYESKGIIDNLKEKLLEEKTLKYLIDNANVIEVSSLEG